MAKVGPNEKCPCGSGLKFKKCCDGPGTGSTTRDDRARALDRLTSFGDMAAGDVAWDELWAELDGEPDDLGERISESEACFDAWLIFDRPLEDGRTPAEHLLDADPPLPSGQRAWLRSMIGTGMRLYEVVEVRPGLSVTLQDLVDASRVTVNEKTLSRHTTVHTWIAARVNPRGPSGGPEIEFGALTIGGFGREALREALRKGRAATPGDARSYWKSTAPLFHTFWARSILDPAIPVLHNTDGERVALTTDTFEVLDPVALAPALDTTFTPEGDGAWGWVAGTTSLGALRLEGGRLVLETNSIERAERGRALIVAAAGGAARHLLTETKNMEREVKDRLRARALGEEEREPEPEIPFEVREQLVLDHYERHYRGWVDGPVPMLEGRTPRQAAADTRLRPIVVTLLHDLEGLYARALKNGDPAYDASWMWEDLGLADVEGATHPLPLAHERVAELVPGAVEAAREVALRVRSEPGFREGATLVDERALVQSLTLGRLTKERPEVAPLLATLANHELHRRKVFWADPDLVWTLSHTELDVPGEVVRAPFPCFALVFTDRVALSRAERWLARGPKSPLAGHLLRVMTVYVTEEARGVLRMGFTVDALGADVPPLHEVVVRLGQQQPVAGAIEGFPTPLRQLIALVIQAILYATSVGVEPVLRKPPSAARATGARTARLSSEEVFYLPGTIDITRLRSLQPLERSSEGRELLHRFLVRGHWRTPPATWKDQRLRWIAPHWKGPPQASVIEKGYRLMR